MLSNDPHSDARVEQPGPSIKSSVSPTLRNTIPKRIWFDLPSAGFFSETFFAPSPGFRPRCLAQGASARRKLSSVTSPKFFLSIASIFQAHPARARFWPPDSGVFLSGPIIASRFGQFSLSLCICSPVPARMLALDGARGICSALIASGLRCLSKMESSGPLCPSGVCRARRESWSLLLLFGFVCGDGPAPSVSNFAFPTIAKRPPISHRVYTRGSLQHLPALALKLFTALPEGGLEEVGYLPLLCEFYMWVRELPAAFFSSPFDPIKLTIKTCQLLVSKCFTTPM